MAQSLEKKDMIKTTTFSWKSVIKASCTAEALELFWKRKSRMEKYFKLFTRNIRVTRR